MDVVIHDVKVSAVGTGGGRVTSPASHTWQHVELLLRKAGSCSDGEGGNSWPSGVNSDCSQRRDAATDYSGAWQGCTYASHRTTGRTLTYLRAVIHQCNALSNLHFINSDSGAISLLSIVTHTNESLNTVFAIAATNLGIRYTHT